MTTLAGKRIVITRAAHQAEELAALLSARQAIPLCYPCIAISPPADCGPLDAALRGQSFDWLIFTSANAVEAVANRLREIDLPVSALGSPRVAVVGSATKDAALHQLGLHAAVIPETFEASNLAEILPDLVGKRVFLPQSAIAAPALADSLLAKGTQVLAVVAYENTIGAGGVNLPALLAADQIDAITFTSTSCVTGMLTRLESEGFSDTLPPKVMLACIGPSTARAATEHGLRVNITATEHTLAGLTAALEEYFVGLTDVRKD